MTPFFYSQDKKGLYSILLVLVVFFTFLPSLSFDYVNWDDDPHFLKNLCVQQPLSLTSVECAFGQFVNDSYIPLTTLSFMLERQYFGVRPFVSHTINLIFHIGVVLLVFFILLSLGCSSAVSFAAALVFGIHPMRVESVVWVTERKDVLYAFFYLAAVYVYLLFIRIKLRSGEGRERFQAFFYFAAVLVLAWCSILSKPMALTLPLVLFLTDWFFKRCWKVRAVLEKCVVGVVVWPVAWWTFQMHRGAAMPVSVWQKILVVLWSATFYIRKMVFPKMMVEVYDFLARSVWRLSSIRWPLLFLCFWFCLCIFSARIGWLYSEWVFMFYPVFIFGALELPSENPTSWLIVLCICRRSG